MMGHAANLDSLQPILTEVSITMHKLYTELHAGNNLTSQFSMQK